ncbi:MAG: nicotinate-nucleotide--dimethylbenzimidazole phosphoribosyltransferase [Desulfobacterales bacterium]|nr:nicotinate-nucleotide--dimethylbenzimidazole phosphoribosyltransferase [Desulfobacterales bacterium]MDD4070826.1 nicotinate-nucleotide--dimethylbenzimidazole phosphoribosyltransferase [Desulfobacterales bacterium]MDD4391228.1 nicotinate-nucleotide--dimethylbenzimidazole phosphoribosyltransferase [Desulfobacterales bacterium]
MDRSIIELEDIIIGIKPVDGQWIEKARTRTSRLVMPTRALGRLHDISERMCGISRTLQPSVRNKAVLIMAADHGIVDEGVSAYPQEVTGEMIKTFLKDGAGINVISSYVGVQVQVVDVGIIPELDPNSLSGGEKLHIEKIRKGTSNFAKGPAMNLHDARQSLMTGFTHASRLFKNGTDIIGTGDMGIGNTTPSAAIGSVITGKRLDEMVGPGTGLDDKGIIKKKNAILRGIELNQPDPENGLDILAKIGGFEIGAIAGTILAAAFHQKPVVVDGLISTAGALIAHCLCPASAGYMFAGHCSEEPGHKAMLAWLGLDPILDLGMRLGEGSGGALSMTIIEAAIRVLCDMMTFDEASVSNKE